MKFLVNNYISIAAISGAICVALGAMGAHKLEQMISLKYLGYFEKGVFYQFIHTLLLLGIGIIAMHSSSKSLELAGLFAIIGILFFSGSLYLLSLQEVISLGLFKKVMIPITPLGGLSFIASWVMLFWHAFKHLK